MVAYSFKRRFVDPIRVGLGQNYHIDMMKPPIPSPKRQTIRAVGKRRHAWPGEILQLYSGMRTKQCFSIGVARCVFAEGIRISVESGLVEIGAGTIEQRELRFGELEAFARADGFLDWSEMQEFWRAEHGELTRLGPFVGVLIQWEPL